MWRRSLIHDIGIVNFDWKIYQINHVRAEVLTTGRMIPSGTNRSPVDVSTQTKKLDPVSKLGVPATQVEHTGIYIVRRMHVCLIIFHCIMLSYGTNIYSDPEVIIYMLINVVSNVLFLFYCRLISLYLLISSEYYLPS